MKNYVAGLVVLATMACASPDPVTKPPMAIAWLCRGAAGDPCASHLDATELRPDGSLVVLPYQPAQQPAADCFYVYPTVDLDLVPRNHEDLGDTRRILATTRAQAARFGETCRLWVPLYRQVTLGAWLQPKAELERLLAVAFADVERAFAEYLASAPRDRPIVLIGHSQGAEMVVRLLRRFFDHDPAMRARLVLAMAIGGDVQVPAGRATGATFTNLPMCTRPLETGCIVAYRTHFAREAVDPSRWAPAPGNETVCVDPHTLDGPSARLARAYYPVGGELGHFMRGVSEVKTPFVMLRDFYEARCIRGERGYAYLAVAAATTPDDARGDGPVDLASRRFHVGKLGLHVLDFQLPQGDLVDMVARRVRSTR